MQEVILLLAPIHFVKGKPGPAAWLMLAGGNLTVLLDLVWSIAPHVIGYSFYENKLYNQLLSYSFTGAALLFVIGLYMLVMAQRPAGQHHAPRQ